MVDLIWLSGIVLLTWAGSDLLGFHLWLIPMSAAVSFMFMLIIERLLDD